jgi:hypothetical protein
LKVSTNDAYKGLLMSDLTHIEIVTGVSIIGLCSSTVVVGFVVGTVVGFDVGAQPTIPTAVSATIALKNKLFFIFFPLFIIE